MFTALARRGYEHREGGEGAGGGNAQSRLVMTELRRAAFFEESLCASWLPIYLSQILFPSTMAVGAHFV